MQPAKRPSHHKQIIIEDIETEGDRQLKLQLKRQLDTSGSIQDHLNKKKSFSKPAVYKPLSEEIAGTHTLSDFIGKEQENEKLDQLRHCGLTPQEIEIYLQSQNNDDLSSTSAYGTTRDAQVEQLEAIEDKIRTRKEALENTTRFAGVRAMGRHEMELERSLTHDKDKAALLGTLVVEQGHTDPSWGDSSHPIHHLDAILQEAIDKRRALQQTNEQFVVATCAPRPSNYKPSEGAVEEGESGKAIQQDMCKESQSISQDIKNAGPSLTPDTCGLDSDNRQCSSKPVKLQSPLRDDEGRTVLQGNIDPIPKEVILKYSLSTDEIRQLDRFKSYEPGVPNKVLFLKNLSSKVTRVDLVSMFQRFQQSEESPITYRLMTGRMAGQAFITFQDEEAATDALNLVNGYHFKGKPIIIQYGKKT